MSQFPDKTESPDAVCMSHKCELHPKQIVETILFCDNTLPEFLDKKYFPMEKNSCRQLMM